MIFESDIWRQLKIERLATNDILAQCPTIHHTIEMKGKNSEMGFLRTWRQGGVNGQRYPANPADDGRYGCQRGPRIAARTPRSGSHSPYLSRVGGTLMRLKSCWLQSPHKETGRPNSEKKCVFFFFFPDISYLTGRCWKAGNFQLPVGKNKKKSGGKKSQTKPNTNQWVDSSQQENMREFLFCFVFPLESETPSTISRAR